MHTLTLVDETSQLPLPLREAERRLIADHAILRTKAEAVTSESEDISMGPEGGPSNVVDIPGASDIVSSWTWRYTLLADTDAFVERIPALREALFHLLSTVPVTHGRLSKTEVSELRSLMRPVDDPPPTIAASSTWNGATGTAITFKGTNFDTTGLTYVAFGSTLSTSVSCPTSTQCTAIAPTPTIAPGASGVVPVTVTVMGEPVNVGTFSYVPPGAPNCTPTSTWTPEYFPPGYGSTTGNYDMQTVSVTCQSPPTAGQQLLVQQLVNGAWVYLEPFTASAASTIQTPNVYYAGSKLGTPVTYPQTGAAAAGSVQSFSSCIYAPNQGTHCDYQSNVTVTASPTAGSKCTGVTCATGYYVNSNCGCTKLTTCACGGVYPNCEVRQ